MGTWHPGPFGSDAAQDLIDLVADEPAEGRAEVLREILRDGLKLSEGEAVDVFPEDVIAAANLVAMSVPGGWERIAPEDERDRLSGALLPDVDAALAALALEALRAMARPGNDWYDTWVDQDEPAREAVEAFDTAVEVLENRASRAIYDRR